MLLIESGGDNLAANYSRELADYIIYVIDVSGGDKIPRKGGPGITQSDLLVVNKTDLADIIGADLNLMRDDAARMRWVWKTLHLAFPSPVVCLLTCLHQSSSQFKKPGGTLSGTPGGFHPNAIDSYKQRRRTHHLRAGQERRQREPDRGPSPFGMAV